MARWRCKSSCSGPRRCIGTPDLAGAVRAGLCRGLGGPGGDQSCCVGVVEMLQQTFLSKVLQRVSPPGEVAWSRSTIPILVRVECPLELVAAGGGPWDPAGGLLGGDSAGAQRRELAGGHDGNREGGGQLCGGVRVDGGLEEARGALDGGGVDSGEGLGTMYGVGADERSGAAGGAGRAPGL